MLKWTACLAPLGQPYLQGLKMEICPEWLPHQKPEQVIYLEIKLEKPSAEQIEDQQFY